MNSRIPWSCLCREINHNAGKNIKKNIKGLFTNLMLYELNTTALECIIKTE